jgi:hypothetical protein
MLLSKRLAPVCWILLLWLPCACAEGGHAPELISLFPLGGNPGSEFRVTVRGNNLDQVHGVWFDCDRMRAAVGDVRPAAEPVKKDPSKDKPKPQASQEITLDVRIDATAKPGIHLLRLFGPLGVSGPLPFYVNSEPVVAETSAPHNAAVSAQPVTFPAVINGKTSRKGEVDFYRLEVSQGQTLRMEVLTGGGLLGAAPGPYEVPELVVYSLPPSWFNDDRHKVVEGKQETECFPFPRTSMNEYCLVRTVYSFKTAGTYFAQLGSADLDGGPDFSYQLRVLPAGPGKSWWQHALAHNDSLDWQERNFETPIEPDQLAKLRLRSAEGSSEKAAPVVKTVREQEPNGTSNQSQQVELPVILEGVIDRPGDADYFNFVAAVGQQLVFEIQTPALFPHYFDPRVSVLDDQGTELFANVYRRIGGDGDDWVKQLENKVVFTFERGGKYWLKVSELTNRRGNQNCAYRILIRPGVPHVGTIAAEGSGAGEKKAEHIEVPPGKSTKLDVISELEEGFNGQVAIDVKDLPPGVRALPAAAVQQPLPSAPGEAFEVRGTVHQERYRPVRLRTTIVLVATKDAVPSSAPQFVHLWARAISGDKIGPAFCFQEIPMMVTSVAPGSERTIAATAGHQARE